MAFGTMAFGTFFSGGMHTPEQPRMVYIDNANFLSYDVAKNVALMFLLGWILTGRPMDGAWIAAMEYIIHLVNLGSN